jgi:RNA polymerase sigma-70 factor (ECF subfamily)
VVTQQPQPTAVGTERLVQRAQAGDRAACEALYGEFARTVHGIALAIGGRDLADDVTQEVFLQAFGKLGELRDPAAFPGWLCTAARRAAIDRLRAEARRPSTELSECAGHEPSPADSYAAKSAADRALACLRRLPAAYRETLTLRLVEGLSGPEIAARTGMTHGSVRVNLTRGMALLRPLLTEAGLP